MKNKTKFLFVTLSVLFAALSVLTINLYLSQQDMKKSLADAELRQTSMNGNQAPMLRASFMANSGMGGKYDVAVDRESAYEILEKKVLVEEEAELVAAYLSERRGNKVTLTVPVKGEKHKLVELAHRNAMLIFEQFGEKLKREEQRTKGAMEEIRKALGLEGKLQRVEAYDISNTQGFESVGAMIVFENGKETHIGDPTETALVELNNKYGSDISWAERVGEIPFDFNNSILSSSFNISVILSIL